MLKELRAYAATLGITIEAERDDYGWGYWLIGTGWPDDNFCVDHDEILYKLQKFSAEQ